MSWKGHRKAPGLYSKTDHVTFNAMRRVERAEKKARAVRFARRDLEYAAAHVPVTVEERGKIVVEWRGQPCIGSRI